MTNAIDLFPRRKLRLAPYGASLRPGLWQVLAMLMFLGGFAADIVYFAPDLIDDYALGIGGLHAPRASIGTGGRCSSRDGLTDCSFDAIYTAGAQTLTRPVHYLAFFDDVADEPPIEVNFSPSDPTHISTSWGRRLLLNRTLTQGAIVAFMIALLGWRIVEFRTRRRLRRTAAAIAADPHPLAARFVKVQPGRQFATIRFAWTDPRDGAEKQDSGRMPRGVQPFWLDAAKQTMLALAQPGGRALLLDDALRTVALTEAERSTLLRARPAAPG